jgi:hypothetical protein
MNSDGYKKQRSSGVLQLRKGGDGGEEKKK